MVFKKFICLLFIVILTGCMASDFNYELNTLKEEVISAEIVEVADEVDKEIEINSINIIGDNDLEEMLTDLSNIQFIWTKGRPQRAKGLCLKLNYINEEYELICADIVIRFNNENNQIHHKDIYNPKGFDEFISKYKIE
jgi:hypothetical protein